jgi:hypothetical protein
VVHPADRRLPELAAGAGARPVPDLRDPGRGLRAAARRPVLPPPGGQPALRRAGGCARPPPPLPGRLAGGPGHPGLLPRAAGARKAAIDFDGKIELVGWALDKPEVAKGETVTVSFFFRCKAPVGDDWLVFIHGDGSQGGAHRIFGDHAPLQGLYSTSEWKEGEILRDDYLLTVPANYPYRQFTLWMGFWKGNDRLPVAQKYQHDGNNRVRTAEILVK